MLALIINFAFLVPGFRRNHTVPIVLHFQFGYAMLNRNLIGKLIWYMARYPDDPIELVFIFHLISWVGL